MKHALGTRFSYRFFLGTAILVAIATATTPARAQAQVQTGTGRPKIGVALEGGGALGPAHIGLLEWFEEHRIPIDYLLLFSRRLPA
jgi:NTE family protein